ncbi:unnamed protein product [Ilex paraguariensis]|uniref:Uncharacterized protein n=1 Tax=Ilex paraguariensis TaxID=185542 RepID=A0ABC8R2B3_9AQUA
MCKLRNLQELDLSRNSFEGNLSSCLSNLVSLRLLELSENNFAGTIPSTLFPSLKSIEYVSLSYNHFEGAFSFSLLANDSKLEVFELDSHNNNLKVKTENPPWRPLFQLKILRLSNCQVNLPSFLLYQYDLRAVNLSHNRLVGKIPTWLLVNSTRLEFLSLANNLLSGPLVLNADSKNLDMLWFDVFMNRIQGVVPFFIGSILPNLLLLNMSKNEFQGSIPPSLGDMRSLDLLSNNNLQGQLLPAKSNLTRLVALFLDNNGFSGEISSGLLNNTNLGLLDLSNNSLSGHISAWIDTSTLYRPLLCPEIL